MEGLFSLIAIGGAGSIAYLALWWRYRERARLLQETAERVGLTNVETSTLLGWQTKLTGKTGPLQVTLESYHRGKSDHGMRVGIGGLRHGSYALTIRPEGLTSSIEKTFGERELELGDPGFDAAAYLQGAPALVRAIFDRETRRLVQALLRGELRLGGDAAATTLKVRASLSDSELRVDIPSRRFDNVERRLPDALPAILEVGRRLLRPDDLAARIAANIATEPLPAVRLANLQTLAAEFPRHEATYTALRTALADDSVAMRLQAAIRLGPEGRKDLLELTSDTTPDDVAAQAIAALGPDFPPGRAIERLHKALSADQVATALACIGRVGQTGSMEGIAALTEVLSSASDELALAAACALGGTAGDTVEATLVAALEHRSAEVRAAAAVGLGHMGSPLAVAPLRAAASAHVFDAALRRAARHAIVEIQSRVTGASPGQLSLAIEEAGQVSLVDEDLRGQVSLETSAGGSASEGPHPPSQRPDRVDRHEG